jgi:hypothetical protein
MGAIAKCNYVAAHVNKELVAVFDAVVATVIAHRSGWVVVARLTMWFCR